jgi:protein involved in polysaccharide export with SLBB domain
MQKSNFMLSIAVVLFLLAGAGRHSSAAVVAHPFLRGDAVRISVYPDTSLFVNGTYHIDDSGYILLPIVGRIRVDTMTGVQFESFLDTAYLRFLRYTGIQVQPLIRLAFLGGFQKPGLYYISPRASLWEALAVAGGPVREDGLKKMKWERHGKVLQTELLPAVESGTSLGVFGIKSGDQMWITHVPKREGWEIFTSNVLPIVSISISTVTAVGTLYFAYEVNKRGR